MYQYVYKLFQESWEGLRPVGIFAQPITLFCLMFECAIIYHPLSLCQESQEENARLKSDAEVHHRVREDLRRQLEAKTRAASGGIPGSGSDEF